MLRKEGIGLVREIANEIRLLARLDVHVLHLLHRRLPIVTEPHFARRLPGLREAERILLLGDRDQFVGRVRNHRVAQVGREPLGADGITDNRLVGGGRVARRRCRCRAGTSLSAARTRHDQCRRRADHARANGGRIPPHGVVEFLIRIGGPPGEERVVAVVIAIPDTDRVADQVKLIGGAVAHRARHLGRGHTHGARGAVTTRARAVARWARRRRLEKRAQAVHRLGNVGQCARRRLRVDCLEIATIILEREHAIGKRKQRQHFLALELLAIHQLQLIAHMVVQQHVVGLAFLRQSVERELAETRAPRGVEGADAGALCR